MCKTKPLQIEAAGVGLGLYQWYSPTQNLDSDFRSETAPEAKIKLRCSNI